MYMAVDFYLLHKQYAGESDLKFEIFFLVQDQEAEN